jgi:hypothetical protein
MAGNHRSGRWRKTPLQHALDGSWRPGRHGPRPNVADLLDNGADPASTAGDVDANGDVLDPSLVPEHLTGTPARLYAHVAPWLLARYPGEAGVLLVRLRTACELLATAETAREVLVSAGLTYQTGGMQRARPESAIQRQAIADFNRILEELLS